MVSFGTKNMHVTSFQECDSSANYSMRFHLKFVVKDGGQYMSGNVTFGVPLDNKVKVRTL